MSTSVKSKREIATARKLARGGMATRAIAMKLGFSKNTVKKIVERTNGYEGEVFDRATRWPGRKYSAPIYVSQIDGEEVHFQRPSSSDYPRVSINGTRRLLHIYEAQKAYRILGLSWPERATVHHVDYVRDNLSQTNLAVFDGTGPHIRHHGDLERAMYSFLLGAGLLGEFYKKYPNVKCVTLADLLSERR